MADDKKRKKSVGRKDPRNPRGLTKDEREAERKLRKETKRYAKKKAASEKEKPARYTRKKYAEERAEDVTTTDAATTDIKPTVSEPRVIEDKKKELTPEQREAILNANTQIRPRRGEEEGVRQEYILGREERALNEIGEEIPAETKAKYQKGIEEISNAEVQKEPINEEALAEERKLRPVPMPEFIPPTAGQERADEAKKGFLEVGRTGIHRFPGAGAVASLPVRENYNIAEAGQGVAGEEAARNAENAAVRADRGMGVAGDEKGMVTVHHVGKAEKGNNLVEEDVSVNEDLARAYAMQKAEHDDLVAKGMRDPRVNPLPHPKSLFGGYYHGLVRAANTFKTTPDIIASYAEKIGGRTGRADVVKGLYGAAVQTEGSEKIEHHVDPAKATRFIDPMTGQNHPIEHLSKFPHITAEMQPHKKTGVMGFMRSKNKYQTYLTNPKTLEVTPGPQSFIGWDIQNIGGASTLIKREKPDNPYVQGLGEFLQQEIGSPVPMGSKSLESREKAADKATGIARLLSGSSSGRATIDDRGGARDVEQSGVASTELEGPVAPRKRGGKKISPTGSGTRFYQPVQTPVVTRPTRPGPVSKQLQNVELDEVGNPKPYAPVVGRRGDEPYYSSGRAQTYNNPFAKTDEEANRGLTKSQIQRAAAEENASKNFNGKTNVAKPKPDVYQGVLDFDNNLTNGAVGSQWEKVVPQPEKPVEQVEDVKIPSSAYVKSEPTANAGLGLAISSMTGKKKSSKAGKAAIAAANEAAPLDLSYGDYRKNALPQGVVGPEGPKIRGKRGGTLVQPELDFGIPAHAGGAQWLGQVQRSDSALVEKVRNQDRNWNYAQTEEGRTSTPLLQEGDFVHHKRFGGGKIVGTQQSTHPITKEPDLHVSVDFGGQTKEGMPNIRTLAMSEHGDSLSKVTPESEGTKLTAPSIDRAKSDKKRYGKK